MDLLSIFFDLFQIHLKRALGQGFHSIHRLTEGQKDLTVTHISEKPYVPARPTLDLICTAKKIGSPVWKADISLKTGYLCHFPLYPHNGCRGNL